MLLFLLIISVFSLTVEIPLPRKRFLHNTAEFGPTSSQYGIINRVYDAVFADPLDGCILLDTNETLVNITLSDNNFTNKIVLMSGNPLNDRCSPQYKAWFAQKCNAEALVVGLPNHPTDDTQYNMINDDSYDGDTIFIPIVWISGISYNYINNISEYGTITLNLTSFDEYEFKPPESEWFPLIATFTSALFFLICITLIIRIGRSRTQNRIQNNNNNNNSSAIVIIYREPFISQNGITNNICTVCKNLFETDSYVSVPPCKHYAHAKCFKNDCTICNKK